MRPGVDLTDERCIRVKEAVDNNTNRRVAMKILDKNKIQEYNMGPQVRKEVRSWPLAV